MNRWLRSAIIAILMLPILAAAGAAASILVFGVHWGIPALELPMTKLFIVVALGIVVTPVIALLIDVLRYPARSSTLPHARDRALMMKGPHFGKVRTGR